MKETGMLFKTEMVRALLDGRKTQTRRIVKGQEFWGDAAINARPIDGGLWRIEGATQINPKLHDNSVTFVDVKSPFGQAGDRIWVRETWQHSNYPFGPYEDGCDVFYRADFLNDVHGPDGELSPEGRYRFWNASIHMPRTASRILLEITDVRIERLHDINEADAIAEGLAAITKDGKLFKHGIPDLDGLPGRDNLGWPWHEWEVDPRKAFKKIWESTGGQWEPNQWVWVYEFKLMETGAA